MNHALVQYRAGVLAFWDMEKIMFSVFQSSLKSLMDICEYEIVNNFIRALVQLSEGDNYPYCILSFVSMWPILHRRLRSIYLSSHPWKNYPSASEGSFGFSWIMLSNDAKIRACFTTFLAATAPRNEAVFSTWKLVSASNRKAKIIYFVPYEGSWTSTRGALRCFWVLVKLWDPHRTPMWPPGTPWGSPRGPERVSEEPNELWHVGYQFSQFSALKMNKGSTYSVDCHWCLGRSIPFLFWSIHTLFTALKWCGSTKTKKGVDRQRHNWRSRLYL